MIEIPIGFKKVIMLCQRAISNKHLMKFYYESKSGNKGYRTIQPYMIILRNGNLELVGLPVIELSKPIEERQAGHNTISQLTQRLNSKQFEVLLETFDDPGVSREIVDNNSCL